jgi:hypothetical protein
MPYQAIEQTLSISRLSTYRNTVQSLLGENCLETAIELYEWNADVSANMLVAIHIYEVALRNAISNAIELRYGVNWPLNVAFQNSLPRWQKNELLGLDEVQNYQSVGKVLPELRPVWYENMFRPAHNVRLWRPFFQQVFPNTVGLTPDQAVVRLKDSCFKIRKLRNRIAHHEPIFGHPTLHQIYPLIIETVEWRCNHTKQWLDSIERVTELLSNPVI